MLVFAINAPAQMADQAELQSVSEDYLGLKPVSKPFSLIDLSRLNWSHSYSMSFFSGGGTSATVGMYTGSIFYELSSSLSLDMQFSIAHNPGSFFDQSVNTDAAFYPSVNLDYHPSDKFRLSVGFASYPGYYYNDPFYRYNPYGIYNWRRLTD